MEKLPRVTAKVFASNANPNDIGQYGSALSGSKVLTNNIEEIQALPAYEEGWRGAVVSNQNYPTLQEMNGLQKTFSQQIAYLLQNGVPEWDNSTEYYQFQFCRVNDVLYYSLIDNNVGNDPATDDTQNWQVFSSGSGYALFDIVLKDRILSYKESLGLAQLGSYVYKEALAGERYGYPDFYNKIVEEFQNESNTTETVNGVSVSVNSNKHKFYDISNKSAIDEIYNQTGEAWYYGVDLENERIFLPRSTRIKFAQTLSEVGGYQDAGLPNITARVTTDIYLYNPQGAASVTNHGGTGTATNSSNPRGILSIDASKSNAIYGNSDTVEPSATKLIPYMVVGNVANFTGVSEVVKQGMEILEQVADKANVNFSNVNSSAKVLMSGMGMPSDKIINLTLGSSFASYTAPANGWVFFSKTSTSSGQFMTLRNSKFQITDYSNFANEWIQLYIPVTKDESFSAGYDLGGTNEYFGFCYAQGAKED